MRHFNCVVLAAIVSLASCKDRDATNCRGDSFSALINGMHAEAQILRGGRRLENIHGRMYRVNGVVITEGKRMESVRRMRDILACVDDIVGLVERLCAGGQVVRHSTEAWILKQTLDNMGISVADLDNLVPPHEQLPDKSGIDVIRGGIDEPNMDTHGSESPPTPPK